MRERLYGCALVLIGLMAVVVIIGAIVLHVLAHNARVEASCTDRGLTYYPHTYGGFCIDRDGRLYGL